MLLLVAFAVLALVLSFVCHGCGFLFDGPQCARRRYILQMMTGQRLRLSAAGALIGLAVALALTGVVTRFGVGPSDPVILVSVSAILIGAALLAGYIPARRAASLEPTDSLRQE
jgi:macrolide transport system ATP-binding/permease protein